MHFGVALIAIFGAAQVAALWRFGEAGIDQNGAFRGMPVDYGRAAIGSVATSCFRTPAGIAGTPSTTRLSGGCDNRLLAEQPRKR